MNWMGSISAFLPIFCYLFLGVALLIGLFRFMETTASSSKIRKYARSLRAVDYRRFQDSDHIMPVSIILPATGEKDDVLDSLENLLSLEFKQYEVIVVADSENVTVWTELEKAYGLLPFCQPYKKTLAAGEPSVYRSSRDVRLIVLDQTFESRAGALNAGVNISSYPIVASLNTNQRLTKDALLKMVYAFVSDPACIYIGSFPRVGCVDEETWEENESTLASMQNIDHLRTLYSRRGGYASLGMYLPEQDCFGAFLKSAVLEAGGFSKKASAEQADLLLRIHVRMRREKRAYSVRMLPDPVCCQIPASSRKQACSFAGRAQAKLRRTLKQADLSARKLPGVRYTMMTVKFIPVIELIGAAFVILSAIVGAIPFWFPLFYLLISALLGAAQSAAAVLLEENAFQKNTDTGVLLRQYFLAVLENFGFRQCLALKRIFPGNDSER